MKRKIPLLIIFHLTLLFCLGAESLTLEEALERARVQNLGLASNAIDVRAAQRDIDTAWNLFLPSLSLSLTHSGSGPVFKPAEIGPVTSTFNDTGLSLGLGMQFTLNAAVKDQLASYNLGYQIQSVSYEQARSEVERNVTKLFYYLLMEQQNIELQEANLELALQQYKDMRAQYERGMVSEIELLSAELSYEQMKSPLQQSRNQYQSNLLSLKAMIGMDLNDPLMVEGDIPELVQQLEVEELKLYLEKSYSVTLMDLNLSQIRQQREMNRKQAFTPSLTLQANYGLSAWNDSFSNNFSDSFSYSVTVALPLDGFIPNSRKQVGMASLEDSIEKLALQRRQTLSQMEVSVTTQTQNLNALSLQADLAERSLALNERLYEMQERQYQSGYISFATLEETRNSLMRAKQGVLGTQFQYINALIDLLYDLNIKMKELN